jgi:hypothetical protein
MAPVYFFAPLTNDMPHIWNLIFALTPIDPKRPLLPALFSDFLLADVQLYTLRSRPLLAQGWFHVYDMFFSSFFLSTREVMVIIMGTGVTGDLQGENPHESHTASAGRLRVPSSALRSPLCIPASAIPHHSGLSQNSELPFSPFFRKLSSVPPPAPTLKGGEGS